MKNEDQLVGGCVVGRIAHHLPTRAAHNQDFEARSPLESRKLAICKSSSRDARDDQRKQRRANRKARPAEHIKR